MHSGGTGRRTGRLPWIVGISQGPAWGAALAQTAEAPAVVPHILPPAPATSGPGLGMGSPLVVRRLRVEGMRSLPEADLQAAGAPFLNRPLRALDLEDLRQRLTRVLVARGFVTSGALLPDNAFDPGTLTLRILEGQVPRVQLSGMQRASILLL